MKTTISICALPLGGIAGSVTIFPDVLQVAAQRLREAEGSLLTDSLVTHVSDWLVLIMVHREGGESPKISALKDMVVLAAAEIAKKRRLFTRNEKEVTCGLTITERKSESFLLFLAGTNAPKLWNQILLSQFANPFATPSLANGNGFIFCTEDSKMFQTPVDLYPLLLTAKYSRIVGVTTADSSPVASAGSGVVMISRSEFPYPTTTELCNVFTIPRSSKEGGVLFPVSLCDGKTVAREIIPIVALGFSVTDGKLSGPLDLFDNPAFDAVRTVAGRLSEYI
ncbi:MAG TPA: fructose 1,6-bisphosphatase [Methanocorpusculum sp.]|nr:fructose 1,6-bisphosphatase [Methanocorpusculum sp.]